MITLKLALRSLLKSPGFTSVAIITLALGIGANASMFSLLNTLMLRPLPLSDPDQMVQLYRSTSQDSKGGFSPADVLDFPEMSQDFGELAGAAPWGMSLSEPDQPAAMVDGARVTSNFFRVARVTPVMGRDFLRAQVYVEQSLQPRFPDVSADDLREAWQDILKRATLVQHHKISREELSVREHMSIVLRHLQGKRFVEFADLFPTDKGVPVLVVTFIAMLELAKECLIELTQATAFAPIYVRLAYTQADAPSVH